MIFITLRVLLSMDRKKLVVAPDLIAKGRRRVLTMLLDRRCEDECQDERLIYGTLESSLESSLGYHAELSNM
jgi:hypothetical protein